MISSSTLQKLIEAGISGAELVEIVQSIEADFAVSKSPKTRSSNAERQARYRENKRNKTVTSNVTNVTEALPPSPPSFPLISPPTTPPIIPQSSTPAPAAQPDAELRSKLIEALGEKNIHGFGVFDLSAIYGLMAGGADLETDILPTLRSKAQTLKRPVGTWSYFTNAITDAHNRRVEAGKGLTPKPSDTDESWTKRLEFARTRNVWDTASLGPMPGTPGCKAPQHLLKTGDGVGWKDMTERRAA